MDTNNLPEQVTSSNTGSPDAGHKKQLLQKLMTNLLSKPGRSMHEVINGVKEAMGAYKNYSKEWDNLSALGGIAKSAISAGAMGGGARGIQDILKSVQQRKQQANPAPNKTMDGMPTEMPLPRMPETMPLPQRPSSMPIQAPRSLPAMPQRQTLERRGPEAMPQMQNLPFAPKPMPAPMEDRELIAGPPQQSSFNRPAPVNQLGIHGF